MDLKNDLELMELLASKEHEIWAKWQTHLHSCCIKNNDGSLTIPKEKVDRWERQINTHYLDLSESEKQSDRNQINKILDVIEKYYKTLN